MIMSLQHSAYPEGDHQAPPLMPYLTKYAELRKLYLDCGQMEDVGDILWEQMHKTIESMETVSAHSLGECLNKLSVVLDIMDEQPDTTRRLLLSVQNDLKQLLGV